ncbi:MAG: hypothetical protein K2N87_16580 [Eubacterium sp.]|nr:hypothetical protein [Eubacterium sp.]
MKKLFYYELRRVLCHWMFPSMLVVNGLYAWYILTGDIIRGVADTAPFSVWSYCAYLGKTMPVAVITILLVLSGYYSKKQKQVEILTLAAPVTGAQHLLIRSGVLAVCFLMDAAVIVGVAAFFYKSFFAYDSYAGYVLPCLLLMLPCFFVAVGAGHLFAGLHQGLCYVLMGILFASGISAPDGVWDLFGAGYFETYPLTLTPGRSGEPGFFLSRQPAWIAARAIYLVLGLLLLLWKVRRMNRKLTKA